ncbi:MAG: Crp/Fnr family transcriptional regulator [Prevotella sp.]|nr:Crp/Fnr family transcriptional regulator [Prevotella sp.]
MPIGLVFEKLLELPLFQGMSRNDLNDVVAQTRFGFNRLPKGNTVVSDGEACNRLIFLTEGTLSVESRADDGSYSLVEQLNAPNILQPERLFGLTQCFTKTFTTLSPCRFLILDKAEAVRLSDKHQIFRINLLNIISTQSQRIAHQPWRTLPTGIRQKVARFIEMHSMRPAGPKILHIKMQTLANEIAESRLNLSRELNRMHAEGLIILSRGEISVPALERLMQ